MDMFKDKYYILAAHEHTEYFDLINLQRGAITGWDAGFRAAKLVYKYGLGVG